MADTVICSAAAAAAAQLGCAAAAEQPDYAAAAAAAVAAEQNGSTAAAAAAQPDCAVNSLAPEAMSPLRSLSIKTHCFNWRLLIGSVSVRRKEIGNYMHCNDKACLKVQSAMTWDS